ncbi:copper homeostasis protein CutC [Mesoplasma seiffertii]|uniref:copper homeostasis protein CutC n=1 Tax=Mesoplasma seiffertii TaxID=28224 RepID=UPI00047C1610|nr:copper homeostasis protein CutC [Mesoplasma seiffertii]
MKLEVIAASIEDIEIINQSSADRIEFCKNLEVGGLTPSYTDIEIAGNISKLPVNIMLRPTARDFFYTEEEFQTMLQDLEFIVTTKVAGVVVGIITPEGEINVERMKQITAKRGNKTITFHKAFDNLKDFKKSLDILQELGIETVLTSAGDDLNKNLEILKELKDYNKVTVLVGGGVNLTNIEKVVEVANEVHVGTAVREKSSWTSPVSVEKINEMKTFLADN